VLSRLEERGALGQAALARATVLARRNEHEAAAALVQAMLTTAPQGGAAWITPIEPALDVVHHAPAWAGALARLRTRAG
jgi:hypothetical protein